MKLIGVALVLAVMARSAFGQANDAAPYNWTTIGYASGISVCGTAFASSVAVDRHGIVYVGDWNPDSNSELIWEFLPSAASPPAINLPNAGDCCDCIISIYAPAGVAVDDAGNIYVAGTYSQTILEVTSAGVIKTLAGSANAGFADGTGSAALFYNPSGVAVDKGGNVYVADTWNNAIRKLTPSGTNWVVTTLAGSPPASYNNVFGYPPGPAGGYADGTGSAAQFWLPMSVAVDSSSNVYVADFGNSAIRIVTPAGLVTTLAGGAPCTCCGNEYSAQAPPCGYLDGTGSGAHFDGPQGVAVDSASNVYVADTWSPTIRKISPSGVVTTIGGPGSCPGVYAIACDQDGVGSAAAFAYPSSVAVDRQGNVFVADHGTGAIRIGVAPTVQLVALEVTQVIQDWSNSIPLIAGKETYLRAHLQLPPNSAGPVKVSEAQLYGYGPNGPLPDSPVFAINGCDASLNVATTNAADPDIRGHFTNSLNFRLPPSWLSGTITLQLGWPGGLQPTNGVNDDCTVEVNFVQAAIPQIRFFDVVWIDLSGTLHYLGTNLYDVPRRVLSCYPVAQVNASFDSLIWGYHLDQPPKVETVNGQLALWLENDMSQSNRFKGVVGTPIYHGAISGDMDSEGEGLAKGIPSFVSSSTLFETYGYGRQTPSHEIGHNLGRQHDVNTNLFGTIYTNGAIHAKGACDETGGMLDYVYPLFQPCEGRLMPTLGPMTSGDNSLIYGLDTLTLHATNLEPVISPTNSRTCTPCFDVMSYCGADFTNPEDEWPSSVTYTALLSSISNTFGSPTPMQEGRARLLARPWPKGGPHPQGGGDGATNYLMVRGIMNFNAGTAQFLPCLPLAATTAPAMPSPGTTFLLEALDDSGNMLQAIPFALEPSITEHNDTNQTADFIVPLTADPSIHVLQLWSNGVLLGQLTASPHAPTVTLTTPNGGQNFTSGSVNIAWSGNDVDGNSLTYAIQYSADGGASWAMLALDLPGQSLGIDSSELAATTVGLMRVIASDGINTAIAQSAATFTVQPHAPAVNINSPRNGSVFIGDIQLFLDASVTDMQDGVLDGTNVQWTSSRDGALGNGDIVTFDANLLSEGYHTITVTAIDSAGLTNSAVTHLWEAHYQPPQLNFRHSPGQSSATISWPSYYTNYVLQASASLVTGWAVLTNQPAVVGNRQNVTVGISGASSFFRLVMQP